MSRDRRVVHLHGRSLNMPGMDSFPQLLAVPMILCLVGFELKKVPAVLGGERRTWKGNTQGVRNVL